jgi:hypothetical protein
MSYSGEVTDDGVKVLAEKCTGLTNINLACTKVFECIGKT